jgi:hypothetical protein
MLHKGQMTRYDQRRVPHDYSPWSATRLATTHTPTILAESIAPQLATTGKIFERKMIQTRPIQARRVS